MIPGNMSPSKRGRYVATDVSTATSKLRKEKQTEELAAAPAPPKVMSEAVDYWDHYGDRGQHGYDEEIASSIDEDKSGNIKRFLATESKLLLSRNVGSTITICDYGCG